MANSLIATPLISMGIPRASRLAKPVIVKGAASVKPMDASRASLVGNPRIAAIAAALPTGGANRDSNRPARSAGPREAADRTAAAIKGIPTPSQARTIQRRARLVLISEGASPAARKEPNVRRKADTGNK